MSSEGAARERWIDRTELRRPVAPTSWRDSIAQPCAVSCRATHLRSSFTSRYHFA